MHIWINLREFVKLPSSWPWRVGRGPPTSGSWLHFRGDPRRSPEIAGEFQIAHFICVFTVKTSPDPPLNPPKARHSSGRPWESLWEGLEELWESLKISKTPTFWVWRSSGRPWESSGRVYIYKNSRSIAPVDVMLYCYVTYLNIMQYSIL